MLHVDHHAFRVLRALGRYAARHHIGFLALMLALSGSAYAATLARDSVGRAQLRDDAVTSREVKNRSLRAADFKLAELPRGPQGETGPPGRPGPRGATGPPGRAAIPLQLDTATHLYGGPTGAERPPIVGQATVGPWRLTYRCGYTIDYSGLEIDLRGPGSAHVFELSSRHSGEPQIGVRSVALDEGTDTAIVRAADRFAASVRSVLTLNLSAGARQATVTATVTGTLHRCTVGGVAVMAH